MKNNYAKKKKTQNLVLFLILLLVGIMFMMPFIWMTVVSFERYANIQPPFPPSFTIKNPSLFNFKVITENGNLTRAYKNSLIVAVCSVLVNIISVMMAGYALSKGKFKGKKLVLIIILATMMIPFETRMIPMYKMFAKIGLTNNFIPLIIPNIIDALGIMLAKNYFDSLPTSLGEAAEMDGAGPFRTFFQIYLPLTSPIAATIVILKFMDSWNAFLWPLVILTGRETRTMPVFISAFSYEGGTRMAGSTMTVAFLGIIPVVIVFLILQKYIIQSIALSGVKGE
jgi:multiple sugar transport system permease protein